MSGCASSDGAGVPGLPSAGEEPDRDLALAALEDERELLDRLVRTRRRHRPLRELLAATERVHRAHVDLLVGAAGGEPRTPTPPAPVPTRAQQALAAVRDAERSLARRHVETSLAAQSGVFARLTASMSAAAAQQDRVLSQARSAPRAGRARS